MNKLLCYVTINQSTKTNLYSTMRRKRIRGYPKNDSALVGTSRLVKDRSQKSGSIRERSLSELSPGQINYLPGTKVALFSVIHK